MLLPIHVKREQFQRNSRHREKLPGRRNKNRLPNSRGTAQTGTRDRSSLKTRHTPTKHGAPADQPVKKESPAAGVEWPTSKASGLSSDSLAVLVKTKRVATKSLAECESGRETSAKQKTVTAPTSCSESSQNRRRCQRICLKKC
ncbi:MAG: hypothetical protein AB7U73_18620, partial [Pirellulales bacterium]